MLKQVHWYGWVTVCGGATFMLTLWQIGSDQPLWQSGVSAGLSVFWVWRSLQAADELLLWAIVRDLSTAATPRSAIHIALSLGQAEAVKTVERLLLELQRRNLVETVPDDDPTLSLYRLTYQMPLRLRGCDE